MIGPLESPSVIHRVRIEIKDAAIAGATQPYHRAAELGLEPGGKFLERCTAGSRKFAEIALDGILVGLRERGHEAVRCGILIGSGRKLPGLAGILASHALIHTAEGEFFRAVVAHACEQRRLTVIGVREKELWARASVVLKTSEDALRRQIADMGKRIGPPWTQDQKHSALAAWMALATPSETGSPAPGPQ
jgi:hypothetical protein